MNLPKSKAMPMKELFAENLHRASAAAKVVLALAAINVRPERFYFHHHRMRGMRHDVIMSERLKLSLQAYRQIKTTTTIPPPNVYIDTPTIKGVWKKHRQT